MRSRAVSLSCGVLRRDLLRAAAELRLLAALVQVLDERAQRRPVDERVRGGAGGGVFGRGHGVVESGSPTPHFARRRARRQQRRDRVGDEPRALRSSRQVISTPTTVARLGDLAEQVVSPSWDSPPPDGKRAGSTVGSSTSRSRWTKTSARRARRRRRRASPARRRSPATPALAAPRARRRRGRARRTSRRVGGSSGVRPKPVSQRPQAPARHMPPRKPLRRRVGRVEVAVRVEPQDARVGAVARDGGQRRQRRSSSRRRRSTGKRAARRARRRPGRRPRAGSRATSRRSSSQRAVARLAGRADDPRARRRAARRAPAPAPRAPAAAGRRGRTSGSSSATTGGRLTGPSTRGSRFSKNACTPSWMSSVENASVSCARRKSSASASAMSCWRNIASLPSRISTGDFARELARPSRRPRRRTPPPATTRLTIPMRSASSARRSARRAAAARWSSCARRCGRSAP